MTENPIKAVGHLPPKRLAVIAVVGIGAGLLLRKFKGGSKTPTAQETADATGVDLTGLALQGSSTGNLGASGGTTGGVDTTDDGTTREVGTITLPVVKWVVTIGGKQFLTDGTNLEEIGGGNATTTPPAVVNPAAVMGAKPTYNPSNVHNFRTGSPSDTSKYFTGTPWSSASYGATQVTAPLAQHSYTFVTSNGQMRSGILR